MVGRFAPRLIAVYVTSLALVACQTSLQDDYSLDDLDDYQIYERGYDTFEDEAIDKTYFNPYEGDYVDPYSESILQKITVTTDCQIAADGSATFNGTKPCDVQVQGVDQSAPQLKGGMDGVYKVATCESGRPLYRRDTDVKGAERVLWYSAPHRDWDFANGSQPLEDDILMWGGMFGREIRPQHVQTSWHFAADFMPNFTLTSPEYAIINATVKCVEGSIDEDEMQGPSRLPKSSLLTDDEQDAQYQAVYDSVRRNVDVSSGVNSGFIVLFVAVGLAIVVGLPFMVARRRGGRRAPGDKGISLATFFGGKQSHSS